MSAEPTKLTGLQRLCDKTRRRWAALDRSREETAALRKTLTESLERLVSGDTSFVAFGSIARQEYKLGSDVDWTLLVDGLADPGHVAVVQEISKDLSAKKLHAPGPTATFGSLTFSHDLVHQIGGEFDSNRNTTQRILLLLESTPIGRTDAYERVIRAVLRRYLDNDIGFQTRSSSGEHYKVPRFLLNDIVRFWRTMCVDYATKIRDRQGAEWALRNAKLRMSRKLIFASGLMLCFGCYLKSPLSDDCLFDTPDILETLIDHLRSFVGRPPIDIMADAFCDYTDGATAIKFFDAYDRFLNIVGDSAKRGHLKALQVNQAAKDGVFREIRDVSNDFQTALNKLFYEPDEPKLRELTLKYGMF